MSGDASGEEIPNFRKGSRGDRSLPPSGCELDLELKSLVRRDPLDLGDLSDSW